MLSIEICKKELEKSGKKYSTTEVEKLRDVLYCLAEIEYQFFNEVKDGQECSDLYESLD